MQLFMGWGEEGWLLSFGGGGTSLGKAGRSQFTPPRAFPGWGWRQGDVGVHSHPPGLAYEWVGGLVWGQGWVGRAGAAPLGAPAAPRR